MVSFLFHFNDFQGYETKTTRKLLIEKSESWKLPFQLKVFIRRGKWIMINLHRNTGFNKVVTYQFNYEISVINLYFLNKERLLLIFYDSLSFWTKVSWNVKMTIKQIFIIKWTLR